jgi:PQQ-dependent dehydrogenase (methanol/ethanol family)
MRCLSFAIICLALALPGSGRPAQEGFEPVTDAVLENPDPGDWLMWRRTHDGWGYSPLDQIDRDNVGELGLVWSRELASEGIQEGTPLVHDGVLYMPNPGDVIQAMDAASGEPIWEYRREWPEDLTSFVRAAAINRNLAIHGSRTGNRIIDTSGDDHVFALDAGTGRLVWDVEILDYRTRTAQQSSGPIIAGGKIISGRNCYSEGGPDACVITAHDAVTGRELWRRRTIPGPGEPGDESWGDVPFESRWHVGTWMVPSYDAELGLIYVGTSVTSPAPKYMLGSNSGEYLYHNSTLALDADTGEIVWYYQHLVDHWDLDHPFERLLIDTRVAPDASEVDWIKPGLEPGETRRVVTGIPGKTGVVYTLDRETGEFLWARPTVAQTVVESIDPTTGRVAVNSEMLFTEPGQERLVCPSSSGGKNWPAGAYSPLTRTMYFPLQNTCMRATSSEPGPTFDFLDTPGARQLSRYGVRMQAQITPGTENVGTVVAISVETGKTLWQVDQRAGVTSLLTTGGGLVFGGDASGIFRAYDQETGAVLFETDLGSAVTGFPISYAVDGRQYVAVSTGSSLVTNATSNLIGESPEARYALFVFALPEAAGPARQ